MDAGQGMLVVVTMTTSSYPVKPNQPKAMSVSITMI